MGDCEAIVNGIVNMAVEDKRKTKSAHSNDMEPCDGTFQNEQESFPQVEGIACTLAPANNFWTTERDEAVKVRFSDVDGHYKNVPAISVMEFFDKSVKKFSDRIALKVERGGEWISWTYEEYMKDVKNAAKAFIKLGLEPYHGVGIIGFNSPEWIISDIAAIYAGGLACGIYTTNRTEACRYVCSDSGCNIAVVENDIQLQKILQVWDKLPKLKAIVQYIGEVKEKRPNVYDWNELMEIGKAESEDELEKRIKNQAPNKCCTLIYTSGTTGNPKGAMLSHDNIISNLSCAMYSINHIMNPESAIQEESVSFLPLSHTVAQMTDIWMPIYLGGCVWFARPDALKGSLMDTLKVVRPTSFMAVPRVYEKMEEKMRAIGATVQGFKRVVGNWAKGVALQGNQNIEEGKPLPYGWSAANYLVLGKIHSALGLDRTKLRIVGGAPISKSTLQYFQSINLPLHEAFGMSEGSGPMTISTPEKCRITSIGHSSDVNEVKIMNPDEDGSGELCFRGRNILMGYIGNEEKTKESLDADGWLHSGDVGKMDEDGFLFITGRIKEIIITAGGENVAPVPIEENIKEEIPFISSAMLIGDKRKFLSCLLTSPVEINLDTGLPTDDLLPKAQRFCSELGLTVTKASEIAPDVPDVLKKAIQDGIDRANKKAISNAARVQKWKLLPLEFTTANGELGPTQKLRRPHVMKMYKEMIDEFYDC